MKDYLENRIKSLSERSAKLWAEYENTTGAAKTALKYRECTLLDERLAELNDALEHQNQLNSIKTYVTSIQAIDPIDGQFKKFCGPNIKSTSLEDAKQYCQNNGLGYCKIEGFLA